MKILFAGDFVSNSNKEITLDKQLFNEINKYDYKIINFEGSVPGINDKPIIKTGPHVCNSLEGLKSISKMGFNICALANNHIMDYGQGALQNTLNEINILNLKSLGAGLTYNDCYCPLVLESDGESIAIFNLCQGEYGVCKDKLSEFGYGWINNENILRSIRDTKSSYSKVIIFAHAGLEEELIPLPEWRNLYKTFIDEGADIIVANHPHIIQGMELYKDHPIYYSLGNFYFYNGNTSYDWTHSYMVGIDIATCKIELIPVEFNDQTIMISDRDEFNKVFFDRSELINDDMYTDRCNDLCSSLWSRYYSSYYEHCINNLPLRIIVKLLIRKVRSYIKKKPMGGVDRNFLLHNIQNETHRWCVERYLYNYNKELNDF